MYHPRFYGDFFDIGYKYGSLLAKHGVKLPGIEKGKIEVEYCFVHKFETLHYF